MGLTRQGTGWSLSLVLHIENSDKPAGGAYIDFLNMKTPAVKVRYP